VNKEVYRILIAGEGGQGVQTMAHVLAEAAYEAGLHVAYMPNYGVEQRGGVSLGFIQIGTGVIGFPKFSTADIIVNLRARAIARIDEYIGTDTLYIYDSDLISGIELKHVKAEKLAIAATSLAAEKLTPKVFNIIMLGALVSELSVLKVRDLEQALESELADKYKKKPQLRNFNKKALDNGIKMAKEAYTQAIQ
jgi:2-oxoglutarate ferredoxin oxidoreductase subunit gamma